MDELIKSLIRAAWHTAREHREQGDHGAAKGWIMIGAGILLLPIPMIGLPLLGYGIWKLFK